MATTRRSKRDDAPLKARVVLNGKDWDDCTEEERDQFRDHATKVAIDVALRPLKEKYGPHAACGGP